MVRAILGALIIAGTLAWILRYDIQPNAPMTFWRLDRWTGIVNLCIAQNPLYEDSAIQLACLAPEHVPEGVQVTPPPAEDDTGSEGQGQEEGGPASEGDGS